MDLRQKFGLLALIYVVSLSANFGMSALCIVVYFDSAFGEFQTGAFHEQQIEQASRILRRQRMLLDDRRPPTEVRAEFYELDEQLTLALSPVRNQLREDSAGELGAELDHALRQKKETAKRWLASQLGGRAVGRLPEEYSRVFIDLELLLVEASNMFVRKRQGAVSGAAAMQERVVAILVANTAAGAVLCGMGVYFVRRWVMYPISDLREAARQISLGNFEYRIVPRSHDELGQLAEEVNQMSATIVAIQTKLLEQERLAAAGEMVTRLAHNIRNPLAGIRGLAEATISIYPDDEDVQGCQERIISTVDRFEKWLRDLQQSVSPLNLNLQQIAVQGMLNDVVTALQPMLDRRGVRVVVDVPGGMPNVQVDCMHFEQAIVALVTNAVQASESGQEVHVRACPAEDPRGCWRLEVEDHGSGIPPEIRQKIFLPYFTTKPDGNGIGLSMAIKVVRLHGGQLIVDSEPGQGSRFEATMPGLVTEV